MKYIVLICDIVESRGISNRNIFQEKFKNAVKTINKDFSPIVISPFIVTLGDEFQGVLKSARELFVLIHFFQLQFPETGFRFGIGCGTIDTEINHEAAIGMDGSAFHNARKAIDLAKEKNRKIAFYNQSEDYILIDQMLKWLETAINKWKIEKLKTVYLYRKGYSQVRIQQEIGVTQPAISQNINSSETKNVIATECVIEEYLNKFIQKK